MAKKKEESVVINIPALNIKKAKIRIIGDTPLIVHAWSEKAKRQMLEKMMKKATTGREVRDPEKEFVNTLYWLSGKPEEESYEGFENALKNGAKLGFPSIAFKLSAVTGAHRAGITKNLVEHLGSFHIDDEYVEIHGKPVMDESMVRLLGIRNPADLRYRGRFNAWEVEITVRYNINVVSLEQLVNFLNYGGFITGIGEHRPEKKGRNGMYHVAEI
jgi:hypothetical protein